MMRTTQPAMAPNHHGSKKLRRMLTRALLVAVAVVLLIPRLEAQQPAAPAKPTPSQIAPSQQKQAEASDAAPALPRGKKLMLKDGSFHLVREYQVQEDRVRYYSTERSQWEEIPAALVDWDATKNVEADQSKRDDAIVAKLAAKEEARRIVPLDTDASLEAAPGVFIPPGEGLFAFDGKSVARLSQAETQSKLSKRRLVAQVLVPIKVVPSRHTISVERAHAEFHVSTGQPEFYMRTADAREPDMELVRAKVHSSSRTIENIDQFFKQEAELRETLPVQRWQVAKGVYRFTLGQSLEPGEYAFVEIVQGEGMSLYVWDFGVEASASPKPAVPKQK